MSGFGHKRYQLGMYEYVNSRRESVGTCWSERLMRDKFQAATTLFRKDFKGHFGCVNAVEFSNQGGEVVASGGDDRRVLVWNVEEGISGRAKPISMKGEHHSNIFCLSFDNSNTKVFSGGNDEQVIVHDLKTGVSLDVFTHEDAVYGLSSDPVNDNVFASACDDGRILIYDMRAPPSEDPFCLANYMAHMHAVVYNPVEPRLLATANSTQGIGLWDVRKPRSCLLRYGGSLLEQSCMSVRINQQGTQVIGLRRRLPPVLYNIHSSLPVFQFDHAGYYNSCTMKSCCFAGDRDQYLISGSDDFNLYVWKIPDEPTEVLWVGEAHLVLRGHRSIVNQVRFNPANHLVVSSGVEKVIKMWSPFEMPDSTVAPSAVPSSRLDSITPTVTEPATEGSHEERPVYTQEEYYNLLLRSGQVMSHDYSHQSLDEDPRMMAFFDALVQRELEGFSSDDDSLDSNSQVMLRFVQRSDSEVSVHEQLLSDASGGQSPQAAVSLDSSVAVLRPLEEEDNDTEETSSRSVLNMDDQSPTSHSATEGQADTAPSVVSTAASTNTLPGQRLLSVRPSISDLITLKRKEYLSNARKVDWLIRRKQKKGSPRAWKQHMETTADSSSSTSSCSSTSSSSPSSSSSECASNNCKGAQSIGHRRTRKRHRKQGSSSDSSPARPEGMAATAVAAIRNKMAAGKRAGFERLRQMRTSTLLNNNSDPNSDDGTIGAQAEKRLHADTNNVNMPSLNCHTASSCRSDDISITTLNGVLQPGITQCRSLLDDSCSQESVTNGVSCSSSSAHRCMDNNQAGGSATIVHANCGHSPVINGASSSSSSSTSSSACCVDFNQPGGSASKCPEEPSVSGVDGKPWIASKCPEEPSVSGVDGKPWMKFKRFSGKERPRRHYRRRVSQEASSGDEAS